MKNNYNYIYKLTESETDTRPRTFRKGENPRPAVGEVGRVGDTRGVGIEPALGDKLFSVGTPDAREAVDGTGGDVDDLALCDWDLVEDVLAVGRANRPT